MPDERKQKLVKLGPEALADRATVSKLVDNLLTVHQNSNRSLENLKRSLDTLDHRDDSFGYAQRFSQILDDVEASSPDPYLGVALTALLYERDLAFQSQGNGNLSEIYSTRIKNLFIQYASSCADKEGKVSLLIELCRSDTYGVRAPLMDSASLFLDTQAIGTMIEELQSLANGEQDTNQMSFYQHSILSCAKQIKDASLFEKTILAIQGEIPASIIEITRQYLASDDVDTAFAWIQKYPDKTVYLRKRYIALLTEIYRRQGDKENLAVLLKKRCRKLHLVSVLEELLAVVGEECRDEIIAEEIPYILDDLLFKLSSLVFLLEVGSIKDAETYLFARTDELAGIWHDEIIPIANTFEEQKSFLATSLIYRGLLDFILDNGDTPFYPFAVTYLKKLDIVAPLVSDWLSFDNHTKYKESLLKNHGRKRSFWAQYKRKYKSNHHWIR